MEVAVNFSVKKHDLRNQFDSTDKILDEIDSKLNGVATYSSQLRQMDVNEDPGVDVSSVRMFRHHMENQNLASRPSQAPDFNSIDCRPHDINRRSTVAESFHEKRTNLLQLYDDDINLLRKMLQENTDVTKPQSSVEAKPLQNGLLERCEDGASSKCRERSDPKSSLETKVSEHRLEKPSSTTTLHSLPPANETYQCSCGLEEELEKMTKNRDELLARIRRGEASKTSIEERQELERQLHTTKSALFQQRKKSRLQLEDIEEKLEEAQHYYDEKLSEKDDIITALQEKVQSLLQQRDSSVHRPPSQTPAPPSPPDTSWMQEELLKRDEEIKQLSDLVSKQNQALNDLKAQLDSEAKQSLLQVNEKVILERKKWEEKIEELKRSHEKERYTNRSELVQLKNEKEKLCESLLELNQKIEQYHKEIEKKDTIIQVESLQKENDYKATIELLRSKIESLKDELSLAFASKSELELDFRRKESDIAKENKANESALKEENKQLENELQHMKVEVTQAVGKLKDFKIDIEHQDQSMASSIYDECQKLFNLLQSIQNSTNIPRKALASKGSLVCKRAVCELQDIVDSVSRSANDLLCELARLKRESRKRIDFSSLRNNNDVTIASEEAKLLREKLNKKESELHDLQVNMNHWKDLTAQRLAEKFQEELQLQVDRKLSQYRSDHVHKTTDSKPDLGRFSKSANNLTNGNSSHGDTSTMKLLCHLQGRVKQLRSENDLLRSSNYIKSLDGR